MKIVRILIVVVVLLVVLAIVGKRLGWIGQEKTMEVETESIEQRTIVETVTASGKLYPETEVKINAEVSGEVINLPVEEGDSIVKGQLLIEINPDLVQADVLRTQAALDQARANLASAKSQKIRAEAMLKNTKATHTRNTALHGDQVISDADFETSEATLESSKADLMVAEETVNAAYYNVKSMEATLRQSRDNLNRTTITAPMDGILTALNVKAGETVLGTNMMQGTEIMRIADLDDMEVHVDVSENDILRIDVGDTAFVEVDAYLGRKFSGVVKQVASSANQQGMTAETATNFRVEIRLSKESYADLMPKDGKGRYPLFPGMSATAEIKTKVEQDVLAVPIQSVTTREDTAATLGADLREMVFVVEEGFARERIVTTGIQDDNYIQVTEGVSEGDAVVSGPYRAIARELSDSLAVTAKDVGEEKD